MDVDMKKNVLRKDVVGINCRYLQFFFTGIEVYLLNLLKGLEKVGTGNFLFFECARGPLKKVTSSQRMEYYRSKFPAKKTFFRILWEQFFLAYEVKKHKCKVFHGPSYMVPFVKSCKYVITIHDLSWFYYPESFTFFNKLYFRLFLSRSIRKADRIIVISDSTKKDLEKFYDVDPAKVRRIYYGCDRSFRKIEDQAELKRVKVKYDLPDKFVLAVSTLLPRKNFVGIIKAFSRICHETEAKLVVIGKKGWLYKDIFKTVKDLSLQDKVIFTGYIDNEELPYVYNLAELFVFPSFYEGFGLPPLEAMACGCPVLTSNVSAIPEVVGDAAILVDPNSVEEIAQGMERLLVDKELRDCLVKKGLQRSKLFSWEKCAEETSKVYSELLE
jgi:glycosyltransferase involved in cell wall biosynthesis